MPGAAPPSTNHQSRRGCACLVAVCRERVPSALTLVFAVKRAPRRRNPTPAARTLHREQPPQHMHAAWTRPVRGATAATIGLCALSHSMLAPRLRCVSHVGTAPQSPLLSPLPPHPPSHPSRLNPPPRLYPPPRLPHTSSSGARGPSVAPSGALRPAYNHRCCPLLRRHARSSALLPP